MLLCSRRACKRADYHQQPPIRYIVRCAVSSYRSRSSSPRFFFLTVMWSPLFLTPKFLNRRSFSLPTNWRLYRKEREKHTRLIYDAKINIGTHTHRLLIQQLDPRLQQHTLLEHCGWSRSFDTAKYLVLTTQSQPPRSPNLNNWFYV